MAVMCFSAQEAITHIKSGDQIWCHSMAATPYKMLEALAEHVVDLENVQLLQLHLEHAEAVCQPHLQGHLRNRCYFVGHSTRKLVNEGKADYVPIFLSEIPKLFRSGRQPIDVALIQVSPPDHHGNCSLGVSVEATLAACSVATMIIAQINPNMPRTHGDATIPMRRIDYAVEIDSEIPNFEPTTPSTVHAKIGSHVAELIRDGDCLQMGIGSIPDAVLLNLSGHQHLGIHTEMFSSGVLPLIESGAIDNTQKVIHRGKVVTGFVQGSKALYDFVDDNSEVAFLDIEYVNNPAVIRKTRKWSLLIVPFR